MKAFLFSVIALVSLASSSAFANWYSCHSPVDQSRYDFEASSSQEINIYQPIKISSQNSELSGVFFMNKFSETLYSASIPSEDFDYAGCNYQGATMTFNTETLTLKVYAHCDGSSPFLIYSQVGICTVY